MLQGQKGQKGGPWVLAVKDWILDQHNIKGIIFVNIFVIFAKQGSAGPRCAECQGLFSYRCPSGLNSKITHTQIRTQYTSTAYVPALVVQALPNVHIALLTADSIFGCIVGGLPGITNQPGTAHE